MSAVNELEQQENERNLRQIAGKPKNIEINERTLEAYRTAFAEKGLVITSDDYPQEDFALVKFQKAFDALVDPSQNIRKIIISMVRQPVTIFDKNGKPEIKDALYFNGMWYAFDRRGTEIGAEFHEGSYKKPRLVFSIFDPINPFDPKTGERRGEYKVSGNTIEHYIFLSADKKERRKQLEDILSKATGTHTGNLEVGGHLSFRQASQNNNHSGTHGGLINWDNFCSLSLEQLAELQSKNYYKDDAGKLKDKDNQNLEWDASTGKIEKLDKR